MLALNDLPTPYHPISAFRALSSLRGRPSFFTSSHAILNLIAGKPKKFLESLKPVGVLYEIRAVVEPPFVRRHGNGFVFAGCNDMDAPT